ncbi:MAG: hypothetical protein AB7O57_05245 [Hyphomicrobiaceae bacterium]
MRLLPQPWLRTVAATLLLAGLGTSHGLTHEIVPGVRGLGSLALHPLVAVDTVLVVLGMALLAGGGERPRGLLAGLPAIVLGAVAGVWLQRMALAVPGLWRAPLLVGLGLGLMVASGVAPGWRVTLACWLVSASVVALAVPPEHAGLAGRAEAVAAVTAVLGAAMALVALPRAAISSPLLRIGARVAGAWIAAIAVLGLAVPR